MGKTLVIGLTPWPCVKEHKDILLVLLTKDTHSVPRKVAAHNFSIFKVKQ